MHNAPAMASVVVGLVLGAASFASSLALAFDSEQCEGRLEVPVPIPAQGDFDLDCFGTNCPNANPNCMERAVGGGNPYKVCACPGEMVSNCCKLILRENTAGDFRVEDTIGQCRPPPDPCNQISGTCDVQGLGTNDDPYEFVCIPPAP